MTTEKRKLLLTNRNGYWSKKIGGKVFYFGKDYDSAVFELTRQEPFLRRGIAVPDPDDQPATVIDLVNHFLSHRKQKQNTDELSWVTYSDYDKTAELILGVFPRDVPLVLLTAEDFHDLRKAASVGKGGQPLSVKTLNRKLGYLRTIFKFASADNYLIDRNLPFQSALKKVEKKYIRRHVELRPPRKLEPEEIHAALAVAEPDLKGMILLGINGGFNNSDVAQLAMSHVTPIPEVLEYTRRKTWFKRVTPLWEETRTAIKEAIKYRPKRTRSPYLFLTKTNNNYLGENQKNAISNRINSLLKRAGVYKPGKNFGALRTTFAEVAKEVGDDQAAKALMGHEDGSTFYDNYAKGVYLPRLKKLTDYVHDWLYHGCLS